MEEDRFGFPFHDQLPTIYHVVSTIMELAPGGRPSEKNESKFRKEVINAYMTKLIDIWSKAFKLEPVQCRKTVKKKIHKELETYYKEVVTFNTRKPTNRRKRQMKWHKKSLVLFDIKKQTSDPNSFQESEKNFYFDQLDFGSQKMYPSEEIDEEFEAEEEAARSAQNEEKDAITEELNYIFEDDVDESVTDQNRSNAVDLNSSQVSNVSLNRSGLARVNSVYVDDASTQTDAFYDQPEVRHTKKYTECQMHLRQSVGQMWNFSRKVLLHKRRST